MNCDRYEQFELGRMEESDFIEHVKTCDPCRRWLEENERLLRLARSLKRTIEAPSLWSRIERDLGAEKAVSSGVSRSRPRWKAAGILRIAAVLVIALGVGYYFGTRTRQTDTRLLSSSTLEKVEDREREYVQAISELEEQAGPVLAGMDVELALLYRDRLEVIDTQIGRLREALAENPANAHIRQYMLAALSDKKETLIELLGAAS
jgi:hypothetical protein